MDISAILKIEIRDQKSWKDVAEITLIGTELDGAQGACRFEYDIDYAIDKIEEDKTKGSHAVSCLFDVNLASLETKKWPSFLLDIFPQGAALKHVVDHYRFADRPENYWKY